MTSVNAADLAGHPFVRDLTAGQVEQLAAVAVGIAVPPGTRLFAEGGAATRMWLIRSGRVALDLHVPGRDLVTVETLGPGDELGLSWLAPIARWQFGAVTRTEVSAFELSTAAVLTLCEANHELGYRLTRRLLSTAISRLQAARIRILDLYAQPAQAGRVP